MARTKTTPNPPPHKLAYKQAPLPKSPQPKTNKRKRKSTNRRKPKRKQPTAAALPPSSPTVSISSPSPEPSQLTPTSQPPQLALTIWKPHTLEEMTKLMQDYRQFAEGNTSANTHSSNAEEQGLLPPPKISKFMKRELLSCSLTLDSSKRLPILLNSSNQSVLKRTFQTRLEKK